MNSEPATPLPGKLSPSLGRPAGGLRVPMAARAMLLGILWLAAAAGATAKDAVRPLFQSDSALTVTLQAPWAELLRNAKDPRRYPAVLGYTDEQGQDRRIEATVETRGVTRLRICRFPPIRIRFSRAATAGTVFEGQRSLKMVTHCRPGKQFEQYYVQEMLAYRIYNLVTDHSFRVRPLDVTYEDSKGGKPDGPRFAFLIEDVRDMARRNGHKRAGEKEFEPEDFDPLALGRFMLFQYLIGNTDWEVLSGPQKDGCCHNVRVTGAGGPTGRIAVPYDFDSAGMVDTSYAAPHERLPITEVTERLFRGFCQHNPTLETVRQEFLGHERAIIALVDNESRLSKQRRAATTRYLKAFYATLKDERRFAREISGKCRK